MASSNGHQSPTRAERGWIRPAALARVEGVSRRTVWVWVSKGLVEVQRAKARVGVRVRMANGDDRDD